MNLAVPVGITVREFRPRARRTSPWCVPTPNALKRAVAGKLILYSPQRFSGTGMLGRIVQVLQS